jgi:hypothetical protein
VEHLRAWGPGSSSSMAYMSQYRLSRLSALRSMWNT